MSSPSSGDRYEEEEEEDGAYESQAKRLKPSAAAEEGEIEYSGAEESESRRDKVPPQRGGGFSGGVRAPSLRTAAGSGARVGAGSGAPSSWRGKAGPPGSGRPSGGFPPCPPAACRRPQPAARRPFPMGTEALPGRGVRRFAPLRGGGPPARGRAAEPGLRSGLWRSAELAAAPWAARRLLGYRRDEFCARPVAERNYRNVRRGKKAGGGFLSSARLTLLSGGAGP